MRRFNGGQDPLSALQNGFVDFSALLLLRYALFMLLFVNLKTHAVSYFVFYSGLQASVIEVPAECVGSYGSTGSGAECGIYSVMSIVFDMIRNICDGHLLFDSTRTPPCANSVSCYQPL